MRLHLAPDLSLPAGAVTETFGILAARGAGKSNTAAVMAEEMFRAGLPFVVVDPVRAWWGLRSSRDGKGPGIAVPIFGGRRGDVPLERTGGSLVADLIVAQRLSCVLDLSEWESEAGKKQFLLDFARRLYQRNEAPLHLFLEEADDYIPQRPMRDEAQLLRAWENIVRRGRARGLGCTLITQRSASLNKNVLTQVQTLIPMRTTGPQDVAAIAEWLKYQQQSTEVLSSLAGLEDGEAWVWSPHFLRLMKRVRFRLRETFDSGATPKALAARPAATLADVDVAAVTKAMAATIERAKAEDPRELRKRITELEHELKTKLFGRTPTPPRVEVPVLQPEELKAIGKWCEATACLVERLKTDAAGLSKDLRDLTSRIHQTHGRRQVLSIEARIPARTSREESAECAIGRPTSPAGGRPALSPLGNSGKRRMLVALAQHPDGLTQTKLSILTGIARRGGTWRTYLGELRGTGFVEDAGPGLRITEAGLAQLGNGWQSLPTGPALLDFWRARLGDSGKRRLFDVLVSVYPQALTLAIAAERSDMDLEGGTWRTYLGELRGLELVAGRGELRASDELFE